MGKIINKTDKVIKVLACQKMVTVPRLSSVEVPCMTTYEWNKLKARVSDKLDLNGFFHMVKGNGYAFIPTGKVEVYLDAYVKEEKVVKNEEIVAELTPLVTPEIVPEEVPVVLETIKEEEIDEKVAEVNEFYIKLLESKDPVGYLIETYTKKQLTELLDKVGIEIRGNKVDLATALINWLKEN